MNSVRQPSRVRPALWLFALVLLTCALGPAQQAAAPSTTGAQLMAQGTALAQQSPPQWQGADEKFRSAAEAYHAASDSTGQYQALLQAVNAENALGQIDRVRDGLQQMCDIAVRTTDRKLAAQILTLLGQSYTGPQENSSAFQFLIEALFVDRQIGNNDGERAADSAIAAVYRRSKNTAAADYWDHAAALVPQTPGRPQSPHDVAQYNGGVCIEFNFVKGTAPAPEACKAALADLWARAPYMHQVDEPVPVAGCSDIPGHEQACLADVKRCDGIGMTPDDLAACKQGMVDEHYSAKLQEERIRQGLPEKMFKPNATVDTKDPADCGKEGAVGSGMLDCYKNAQAAQAQQKTATPPAAPPPAPPPAPTAGSNSAPGAKPPVLQIGEITIVSNDPDDCTRAGYWGAQLADCQKTALEERRIEAGYERQGATASGVVALERYPAIETPNRVIEDHEFTASVSLNMAQIAPKTRIVDGKQTASGALAMNLPANEEHQWKIDVVLATPGDLEISRGDDHATIVLPETGNSTPALFYLKAPVSGKTEHEETVLATLWYQGAYLARIQRDLKVDPESVAASAPESAAAAVPDAALASSAPTTSAAPVPLDFTYEPADLTMLVMQSPVGGRLEIIIDSPYLQPARYEVQKPAGMNDWLTAQYAQLATRSARAFGEHPDPQQAQPTADFLRGFGRQLYRSYAPAPFQDAFWTLVDRAGAKFHTIQIITDDPTLPWELMRPVRPNGSGERDFLGSEFTVARWHLDTSPTQFDRPPQREALQEVEVVAPNYTANALPGQKRELQALDALHARRISPGNSAALRQLLADMPQGIVHFAGHGAAGSDAGAQTYGILLEDGPVDVMTLRGMEPSGPPSTAHHPLVFFNACEVGQAAGAPNFVDGWAPELLRAGASGYIGALWAVNDTVAADVSQHFYRAVQQKLAAGQGANVGEILTQTKREVFASTGNPTALAYVFYGDPNLTLQRPH